MLNKILQLTRPLGVLDLETTGLNPEIDRIVQIALTMHYPSKPSIAWSTLVDPGIPIMNTGNHSITDAMVAGKPKFEIIAPTLAPRMLNIDIMGYNVGGFDIPFIKAEFKRANVEWNWNGVIIDPMHIYKLRIGHNLQNCYREYVDPKGFEGSHNASVDVAATEASLIGQLTRYTDLPRTVKELSSFCFPVPENALDKTGKIIWVGNEAALNFGKWRGRLLKDPEIRSYLYWIAQKGDFSEEVKEIASEALEGRFPTK
jgi:DNA polymerase III subunit epsilon